MRNVGIIASAVSVLCVLGVRAGNADPIYCPQTGHWYEVVLAPGIHWVEARQAAFERTYLGFRGYLATITSAEEDAFILQTPGLMAGTESWLNAWIGASRLPSVGPWQWVTGEPWSYTHWAVGEPSGDGPCVQVYSTTTPHTTPGAWNDIINDAGSALYLVEYAAQSPPIPIAGHGPVGFSRCSPSGSVQISAVSSYDPDGGSIGSYRWDFNDDGLWDYDTPSGRVVATYEELVTLGLWHPPGQARHYAVKVQVVDDEGDSASTYLQLRIPEPTTLSLLALGAVALLRRRGATAKP